MSASGIESRLGRAVDYYFDQNAYISTDNSERGDLFFDENGRINIDGKEYQISADVPESGGIPCAYNVSAKRIWKWGTGTERVKFFFINAKDALFCKNTEKICTEFRRAGLTPVSRLYGGSYKEEHVPAKCKPLGMTNLDVIREKDPDESVNNTASFWKQNVSVVPAAEDNALANKRRYCRISGDRLTEDNAVLVTLDTGLKFMLSRRGIKNALFRNDHFDEWIYRDVLLKAKFEKVTKNVFVNKDFTDKIRKLNMTIRWWNTAAADNAGYNFYQGTRRQRHRKFNLDDYAKRNCAAVNDSRSRPFFRVGSGR